MKIIFIASHVLIYLSSFDRCSYSFLIPIFSFISYHTRLCGLMITDTDKDSENNVSYLNKQFFLPLLLRISNRMRKKRDDTNYKLRISLCVKKKKKLIIINKAKHNC